MNVCRVLRLAAVLALTAASAFSQIKTAITFSPAYPRPGETVAVTVDFLGDCPVMVMQPVIINGSTIVLQANCSGLLFGALVPYTTKTTFAAPVAAGRYDVEYLEGYGDQRYLALTSELVVANACDFGLSLTVDLPFVQTGDTRTLTWCNPGFAATDFGYYVNFYRIFSAVSPSGPFTALTDVTTTQAQITPTDAGTRYYYVESHGCQGVITSCGTAPDTTKTSNIVAVSAAAPGTCPVGPRTICAVQNRFAISARWQTAGGANGSGHAVQLTDAGGYFWFFDKDNIEVTAKILDACSLKPPAVWFFASGMTNVSVDLTVTDTKTNTVKHYTNALGTPFTTILDTKAFGCQ